MDVKSKDTLGLKRCASAPIINQFIRGIRPVMNSAQSSASSRDINTSLQNIFTPRARRYSASYSSTSLSSPGPRLTPRVSQLRQEECADISNSREVNHERGLHSAMQMSQSCEDLTLSTENLNCRSDDLSHPLHVLLPTGPPSCSSPSPTSRTGLRLPYSPSPTRKTFATRRSMSPIAMRPSTLGPVKRKFELDEPNGTIYSSPPMKKFFTERGPSPSYQTLSPSSLSPDPLSYEGRTTPKLFVSKLCTNSTNSSSSFGSSPSSASPQMSHPDDNMTTIDEYQELECPNGDESNQDTSVKNTNIIDSCITSNNFSSLNGVKILKLNLNEDKNSANVTDEKIMTGNSKHPKPVIDPLSTIVLANNFKNINRLDI